MNGKRVKILRERFEEKFGSRDRTSDAYKYNWRRFKKSTMKFRREA